MSDRRIICKDSNPHSQIKNIKWCCLWAFCFYSMLISFLHIILLGHFFAVIYLILLCCPRLLHQINDLKLPNSSVIPNSCLKTAFSINTKVSNASKLSLACSKETTIYLGLTLFGGWVAHSEGHTLVSNNSLSPGLFSLIIWKCLSSYSWSIKPGLFSSFKSKCHFNT